LVLHKKIGRGVCYVFGGSGSSITEGDESTPICILKKLRGYVEYLGGELFNHWRGWEHLWLKMRCKCTMFIKIGARSFGAHSEMIFVVDVDLALQQWSVRKTLLDLKKWYHVTELKNTVMSNFAIRWRCTPRTLKLWLVLDRAAVR